MGAYKGYELSSKLRSLSGKEPTVSKTLGAFRTLAQANGAPNGSGGSGYDQSGFYQLVFRQAMFILKYKTLDSQSAVGNGIVSGDKQNTGGTETEGLTFGETTGKIHMKLFGIEDFYGNVWQRIDGYWSDASRNACTATQGFNDTGSGYTNQGQAATADQTYGWLTKVSGTSEKGFTAVSTANGSETTYWCDASELPASRLPVFGGSWFFGSSCGVFCLVVNNSASNANYDIGSRLMYL